MNNIFVDLYIDFYDVSMDKIIDNIKKYINRRLMLGILVGAAAGYGYYYFIGCNNGTCAITSNPVNSTLYGVLMGVVLFLKKSPEESNEPNAGSQG